MTGVCRHDHHCLIVSVQIIYLQLISCFSVAISATLPNLGHIASFVESGEAYMFDQSYSPSPLNVYVQACGHIGNNRYLFDKSLKQHVPRILRRFSSGRPSIVFSHSKKETEKLANDLTKSYLNPSSLNKSALLNYSSKTDNALLHQCICKGITFHHAGLDPSD
jgi:ATP-dependent DNA helicase HFM1/MER3